MRSSKKQLSANHVLAQFNFARSKLNVPGFYDNLILTLPEPALHLKHTMQKA